MTHTVARIYVGDDGEPWDEADSKLWHLVEDITSDREPKIFCTGWYTIEGANDGLLQAEFKKVKRGGITCPNCLDRLRQFKAIKL